MSYDLIIFDCDGTLVDSEELNCRSFSEILAESGFDAYTHEVIYNRFVGIKLSVILEMIAAETGRPVPAGLTNKYLDRVAANAPRYLRPLEGAREIVQWSAARFSVCVGSNGERANVLTSVAMTGLKEYFPENYVFTACQVTNPKPAPDLFLHAAEKMGARPEKTLVIEDSPTGVAAGQAAGMTVVGSVAAHPHKEELGRKLREAGANHIITSLAALRNLAA